MTITRTVNNVSKEVEVATYFGLTVLVLCRMGNCTLVRFGNREFVVETQDLLFQLGRAYAA
jgi:hypothetical protein